MNNRVLTVNGVDPELITTQINNILNEGTVKLINIVYTSCYNPNIEAVYFSAIVTVEVI